MSDWTCSECGTENFGSRKECRGISCYNWRPRNAAPPPAVKRGDWKCSQCGGHQFASRMKCRDCGCPKSKIPKVRSASHSIPAPIRPGDWICSACSTHQFAKNTQCRDCGGSKPVREDSEGNELDDPCIICYERVRNAGLMHVERADTAHMCSCFECAQTLKQNKSKCPMCRQSISSVIKIFR